LGSQRERSGIGAPKKHFGHIFNNSIVLDFVSDSDFGFCLVLRALSRVPLASLDQKLLPSSKKLPPVGWCLSNEAFEPVSVLFS